MDVVMMGNGYTLADRIKCHSDVERFTYDVFEGTTFNTSLPLFNIWSVCQEIMQSGVGTGGRPLNTSIIRPLS